MSNIVIPVFPNLHAKSDSGRQRVGTGVLAGGIPGSVIRSEGLMGNDAMLKSTTGEVRVVFEWHGGR